MTPNDARALDRLLTETMEVAGDLIREAWEHDRLRTSRLEAVAAVEPHAATVAAQADAILSGLRLRPAARSSTAAAPPAAAQALAQVQETIARMQRALQTLHGLRQPAAQVRDQWYRFW